MTTRVMHSVLQNLLIKSDNEKDEYSKLNPEVPPLVVGEDVTKEDLTDVPDLPEAEVETQRRWGRLDLMSWRLRCQNG